MSSEKTIDPQKHDSQISGRTKREVKSRNDTGSLPAKILTFRRGKKLEEDAVELPALVNDPAMPFHHLIPAALLGLDSSFLHEYVTTYRLAKSTTGSPFFWQSLPNRGISAKEAALFDDSIECSFIEPDGSHLIQVDWEALHYSALEACAELYLAEMFICKQRLYEAGDEVPDSLEFSYDDLAAYLPEDIFKLPLVEDAINLFLDSLSASFILTISRTGDKIDKSSKRGEPLLFADLFKSHMTQSSRRTKGWSGTPRPANGKQTGSYTVKLAEYWHGWVNAARLAKFDFKLLKKLTDARAVRFYELTKLWRVPPIGSTTDNLPDKLEIEYEKFVSLMPLPRLTSEPEAKRQIDELIKPLRREGYVKSFTFKPDWRDNSIRSARLNFRFND